MAHMGSHDCHWCDAEFPWSHAMRRHDHRGARRFLQPGDAWRNGGVWGEAQARPPPPSRTHAGIIRAAEVTRASDLKWEHKQHPRRDTGVDGPCPLALVPLFDLVWDVCMDFMHIVKVLISGHLLPLLKSKRGLTPPQVKVNAANNATVRRYNCYSCSRVHTARSRLRTARSRKLTVVTVSLYRKNTAIWAEHRKVRGQQASWE